VAVCSQPSRRRKGSREAASGAGGQEQEQEQEERGAPRVSCDGAGADDGGMSGGRGGEQLKGVLRTRDGFGAGYEMGLLPSEAQALLLLEDRGLLSWQQTWLDRVKAWLAGPASLTPTDTAARSCLISAPAGVRLLVIMAEQTNKSGIVAIERELDDACAEVRASVGDQEEGGGGGGRRRRGVTCDRTRMKRCKLTSGPRRECVRVRGCRHT